MNKLFVLCSALVFSLSLSAQESNNGKKLWAKSILNEKAPALVVEEWLNQAPQVKGKFVLIDFWATWCGHCRELIPELNTFAKDFADDLVVIGISDESKEKVQGLKDPVPTYFSAIDTKKRMNSELKIKGIPHCILIDPQGIVRWEGFPSLEDHKLTADVIKTLIEKYKK